MNSVSNTKTTFFLVYTNLGQIFRVTGVFGGFLLIISAMSMLLFGSGPRELMTSAYDILGTEFLVICTLLVGLALLSIFQMANREVLDEKKKSWMIVGSHASNGIATLALTFTLYGISKGIGGLSSENLNINQINMVITNLTSQFSMAFFTSVVGLPLSAILRATVALVARSEGLLNTK